MKTGYNILISQGEWSLLLRIILIDKKLAQKSRMTQIIKAGTSKNRIDIRQKFPTQKFKFYRKDYL